MAATCKLKARPAVACLHARTEYEVQGPLQQVGAPLVAFAGRNELVLDVRNVRQRDSAHIPTGSVHNTHSPRVGGHWRLLLTMVEPEQR